MYSPTTSMYYNIFLLFTLSFNLHLCQLGGGGGSPGETIQDTTSIQISRYLATIYKNETFLLSSRHQCGETCNEGLGSFVTFQGVQGCLILDIKRSVNYQELVLGNEDAEKIALRVIAHAGASHLFYTLKFVRTERGRDILYYYCCYQRAFQQYIFGKCPLSLNQDMRMPTIELLHITQSSMVIVNVPPDLTTRTYLGMSR